MILVNNIAYITSCPSNSTFTDGLINSTQIKVGKKNKTKIIVCFISNVFAVPIYLRVYITFKNVHCITIDNGIYTIIIS